MQLYSSFHTSILHLKTAFNFKLIQKLMFLFRFYEMLLKS
jgi:hypothetical protein